MFAKRLIAYPATFEEGQHRQQARQALGKTRRLASLEGFCGGEVATGSKSLIEEHAPSGFPPLDLAEQPSEANRRGNPSGPAGYPKLLPYQETLDNARDRYQDYLRLVEAEERQRCFTP